MCHSGHYFVRVSIKYGGRPLLSSRIDIMYLDKMLIHIKSIEKRINTVMLRDACPGIF